MSLPNKELKDGTGQVFGRFDEDNRDEKDIDFCKEEIMQMAFEATFADKFEAMEKHPSTSSEDSTFN